MDLADTFDEVSKSIVAFIPKIFPSNSDGNSPEIPPIFGTGYIVNSDGIIATNNHVIEAFRHYQKSPADTNGDWPVYAFLFHRTRIGVYEIPLEILGVGVISEFSPGVSYFGPPKPDLAFVHVKARGLPALKVNGALDLRPGLKVATAGFPMGSDMLTAPGWLHQICPTLQLGIISAVHPFAAPTPHSFAMDIMVQGGASGSPVFLPETGEVLGTLFASITDTGVVQGADPEGNFKPIGFVPLPTSISHAVPAHYMTYFLEDSNKLKSFCPPDDTKSIEQMISAATIVRRERGRPGYTRVGNHGHTQSLVLRCD